MMSIPECYEIEYSATYWERESDDEPSSEIDSTQVYAMTPDDAIATLIETFIYRRGIDYDALTDFEIRVIWEADILGTRPRKMIWPNLFGGFSW
jgi:hypothetical protein